MFINFSDIPGHQNLFLDYLYEFENVKDFYKTNFRDKENYLNLFKKITDNSKVDKREISDIILNQYNSLTPSTKTTKNIKLLKEKKTLAVVTGQQLGIIGGPLYTFYKIITAVKLCSYLSDRYDNYNFVPVFWLEGDDHDFNEVRSITLLNDNNDIVKINYDKEITEEDNPPSVGNTTIKDTIDFFFESLNKYLRSTEFTPNLIERCKLTYSEGKSFKQAFKELIFWLFDSYGLIIFDPQDGNIKKLLKPIFQKELTDFRKHTEKLVNVSAKLEEVYHAQVKIRPINLFYGYENGRFLIEPVDNEFRLKRKRKKFTYEELIALIDKEPENFSPNVLLRPICQDYLLPTVFYIGGPSEISYFAQVQPLYDFFDIEAPIIYPRASVTLLEKNISLLMQKFNLPINELFLDTEILKLKILDSISENGLDEIFNNTSNQIEITLDQLKEKLFEIDKGISDVSGKYKQKILHYLKELKGKAAEAQKRKHETTIRQVDKMTNLIYPNSNLQERELNFIYFANKYGTDFLKQVMNELVITRYEHQVIEI